MKKPNTAFRLPPEAKRGRVVFLTLSDEEKGLLEAIASRYRMPLVATLRHLIRREFQSLEKPPSAGGK